MNEGYSEITQIISQIKKKKIELEALLGKHNDDIFTKKIMNAILKVEGLISKAKKLQMSIDVKGYTTSHKVSSGILHSKLLKEINQIKKQEQEINETKFSIEKLIAETPSEKWKKPEKKPKAKPKVNSDSWEVIDIPFNAAEEEDQDQTGEELISYAKTSAKAKVAKTTTTTTTTKDHYKSFSNDLSQIEKRNSLEVQEMIGQFRKIRSDLDSMLSSYRGQKYRKKIMDSIIKIKASINTLLSMQSSFKVAQSNAINHSATINRVQFEKQISTLKKEKKEMLEKLKILKAKVAKEKREIVQQSYETTKTIKAPKTPKTPKALHSRSSKSSDVKDEKDPAMVNILLKMGVLKKKNKDK